MPGPSANQELPPTPGALLETIGITSPQELLIAQAELHDDIASEHLARAEAAQGVTKYGKVAIHRICAYVNIGRADNYWRQLQEVEDWSEMLKADGQQGI
jgi:hypothetical protein